MVDSYAHTLSLFLPAFFSVGPAISLLFKNARRRGVTVYFLLPTIALFFIIVYMFIDINLAWAQPRLSPKSTIYRGLVTMQFVADGISSFCLGWAYFLRFRMVMSTSIKFGDFPRWVQPLLWLTAVMPTIYPASPIVGIVATWNNSLGSCCEGNLSRDLYGSFNIAFFVNAVIMEWLLAYVLFSRTLIDKRRKHFLLTIVFALSSVPAGMLAGAIVVFFEVVLGTQIIYAFWLVNVWVFMETNRIFSKTLEGKSNTESDSRGSSEMANTTPPV